MSQMINLGKELLRISPKDNAQLEYSTNEGRTWNRRFPGNSSTGKFEDLLVSGREILATTSRGLYYSTNDGRTWNLRKRN